jgi:hypothetical protein
MHPNIFDDFMRAIQQFVSDYGVLGITIVVLVVILTVLWILLPLAVYPLYGSVWRCSRELRVLNRKLDQLVINTYSKSQEP